jgi:hypothetical protein
MFRTCSWFVLIFISTTVAKVPRLFKKDKRLYCVMCNSIIHTISERMEHYVGRPPLKQGFRLSDEGKKIYKEIPYTQSEGVLIEVLDDLLPESYSGYTTKNDKKVKPRHRLMVGNSFSGGLSTQGDSMSMSGDAGELLTKMGDRLIMDYNDKLFDLLKEEGHKSHNFVSFCRNQLTKKCSSNEDMDADAIYAARGKTVWRPKDEL